MQARFEKRIEERLVLAESGGGIEIDEQGDNVYTASRLQKLLDDGRYVMVDYTADWCLTCKVLENAVLKTDRVQSELNRRKVIRLVADWTELHSELGKQIELELERLKQGKQLPIIAFYFPDDRQNPRTLVAAYTTSGILEILEQIPIGEDVEIISGIGE